MIKRRFAPNGSLFSKIQKEQNDGPKNWKRQIAAVNPEGSLMAIHVSDAMLDTLVQRILGADDESRAAAILNGAARLLEIAGYGLAPTHGSDVAGRLLMRAAEIEKLAIELDGNDRQLSRGASFEH